MSLDCIQFGSQLSLDFGSVRISVEFGFQFGFQFSSDGSSVRMAVQFGWQFSSVGSSFRMAVQFGWQFSSDGSSVQFGWQFSSVRIVRKRGENWGSVQFSSGRISSVYFTTRMVAYVFNFSVKRQNRNTL